MAKLNKNKATVVIVKAQNIVDEWNCENDGEKMEKLVEEFEKAEQGFVKDFMDDNIDILLDAYLNGNLDECIDSTNIGEEMVAFAKELNAEVTYEKAILITELFKVYMFRTDGNLQYLFNNKEAYAELLGVDVDKAMTKIIISGLESLGL